MDKRRRRPVRTERRDERREERTERSFGSKVWWLVKFTTICGLLAALSGAGIAGYYYNRWVLNPPPGQELPDVNKIGEGLPLITTRIYERTGKKLIGELAKERRTIAPFAEIPQVAKNAILAAEDNQFYYHPGISRIGIVKAGFEHYVLRRRKRGASTITQQVIKLWLGNGQDRGYARKVREWELAARLEKRWNKDEILAFYLNQIDFGNQRFGVQEASRFYFGKNIKDVGLFEASLLACLPKSPSDHSKNLTKWKDRQKYVLAQMVKHGWATQADADKALATPIMLIKQHPDASLAPEFVDQAEAELKQMFGEDLGHLGLSVITTCDLELQIKAREALENGLDHIDEKNGEKRGRPNGATAVINPVTREVLAMIGGSHYVKGGRNNVIVAIRQPGSTFKAFVWAAGLFVEREDPYTLSSVFIDEEKTYEIPGSKPWTPHNHEPATHEPVTMRYGFIHSLNTVSAEITYNIWPQAVVSMAKRLGIKTELERTYTKGGPSVAPLSLALGTSEVTPLELLNAYAVFPSGGYLADPYFIREFTTPTGQRSVKEPPQAEKVLEPPLVYLMTSLMQDVVQNGTAIRAKKVKFGTGKGQSVAGKTGTTQSATDAWFVGFSPDIAAVVWVGNNDSTPLGSYWEGSRAALPIWIEVMKAALQNHGPADFGPPPPGVVQVNGEYYLEGKVPPPPTPDGGIDPNAPDGGTPTTPVAEAAAQNSPDAGNQPPEPEIAPAVTSEPINQ